MSEVKRYDPVFDAQEIYQLEGDVVFGADFDRVTAERDAALDELAKANEKIDKAWNRTSEIDHKGFIPGALDAWKRPVPQHLPYDFSGNPGESAIQYCNGWNDCGGYWSAHVAELQQRMTAEDERVDVLEKLVRQAAENDDGEYSLGSDWHERYRAALKPAEGGGDGLDAHDRSSQAYWADQAAQGKPYEQQMREACERNGIDLMLDTD